MIRVASGFAARGIRVATFNFPYKEEGRKLPDPGAVLEDAFRSAWEAVARERSGLLFAGGKSMGGRIASQVAARDGFTPAPAGLIFFGYPLHPPGKPAQRRDRHLPNITTPMLFLGGTRDPFGSPEELQALVAGLPTATLQLTEGGDHSLAVSKKQDPAGASLERAIDVAVAWIHARVASQSPAARRKASVHSWPPA